MRPSTDHERRTAESPELTFDQPLPRAVVHKSGSGEVFLTDSVQTGPRCVLIAGELPRSHAFYNDEPGAARRVSLLAALELTRQTAYVLGHRHLGAELHDKYVLRSLFGELSPQSAGLPLHRPTPVVLEVTLDDVFTSGGQPVGVRTTTRMVAQDGPPIGTFGLSVQWMDAERWRVLRAGSRVGAATVPPPRSAPHAGLLAPADVGRGLQANVLVGRPRVERLTAEAGPREVVRAELLTDPHHAPIFDHPGDHVSGMALIEGWRQLAVWATARHLRCTAAELVVDAVRSAFSSVAEFDGALVADVSLTPTEAGVIADVRGTQDGRSVGVAQFALRRPA